MFLRKKLHFFLNAIAKLKKRSTFANENTGKSHTASSLRILQGLIAAKVVGCSGAIWQAYPPCLFSSVGQST